MSVAPRLRLRQAPGLALTPGMRQSLSVLAMAPQDLAQEITREAEQNPFLTVTQPPRGALSAHEVALETVAARPSLGEVLRRQIGEMDLPPAIREVALYLTGALRDDGYLDASESELVSETGHTRDEVRQAIAVLQRCEPPGVGARDLAECLALQLIDKGIAPDLASRAVGHLGLFAHDDFAALARRLDLSGDEVHALDASLRGLSPHPVAGDPGPDPAPLIPDLIVESGPDGTLAVRLVEGAVPVLGLDRGLLSSVPDPNDPFVANARIRAEALIRSVSQRGETLLRIGARLVEDQHLFFTNGPEYLAPLSRRELAEELDLHPSTLGRAVTGKALIAGGAVYPLSLFFPSGLPAGRGGRVSSHAIKIAIRRMVEQETPAAPLSDAAMHARLVADGIDITRRCVAKYRESMRIPSSVERRRRNARQSVSGLENAAKDT